jgi:hypothetical protein
MLVPLVSLLATTAAILREGAVRLQEAAQAAHQGHSGQDADQPPARASGGEGSGKIIEAVKIHGSLPPCNTIVIRAHDTGDRAMCPPQFLWVFARNRADTVSALSAVIA